MESLLATTWELVVRVPRDFSGKDARAFLDKAPDFPAYATVLYFLCVFWLPEWMARREPFRIKYLVAGWNLLFSLFSILGTVFVVPMLWESLATRGFHGTVCTLPYGADSEAARSHSENLLHRNLSGPRAFFLMLFMYAKTPELADTLFLVLQKKSVRFLHWYHHIVTALFCWHASYVVVPSGVVFAAMNYTVHALMYLYFCGVVLGHRNLIRPIAPLITIMQVFQMFIGMGVTVYMWLNHHLGPAAEDTWFYQAVAWLLDCLHGVWSGEDNPPNFSMAGHFLGCDTDTTSMRMGLLMYGSYCILFAELFGRLYLHPLKVDAECCALEKQ